MPKPETGPILDGLVQRKGAPRPTEMPQRGAEEIAKPVVQEMTMREPKTRSLTLRLSEAQYERLRRFAFERRLSHQDVLERAMLEHLERQDG
jgi:hypothetical protein